MIRECYTGFNLDPKFENHVHELELGEKPLWVPMQQREHIACQETCNQCFIDDDLIQNLRNIHKKLGIKREQLHILIWDENKEGSHREVIKNIFREKIGYKVFFNFDYQVNIMIYIISNIYKLL